MIRRDSYELPVSAVRELIANAVTHRSYIDEGCIQVALFDDRLEVTSPGRLFGGLSIEEIREGQSRPRNRAIASAFSAMKIIEHWGSGIPRVIAECSNYGLREPELLEFGMSFRVNLYRDLSVFPSAQRILSYAESLKSYFESSKSEIDFIKHFLKDTKMTRKQMTHVAVLYQKIGPDQVFGRGRVCDILECAGSTATALIAEMKKAGIIEAVTGQGKGKYIFKCPEIQI